MIDNKEFEAIAKSEKYRCKPFWSWNGTLEQGELIKQIDHMKEMGFGGFFMHSRTGLETEYLGEEWFNLIRDCAEYAQKIGVQAWIYDEDRWPSGSCGGLAAQDRELRARFISLYYDESKYKANADVEGQLARFAIMFDAGGNMLDYKSLQADEQAPSGYRECFFVEEIMKCSGNYNGFTYIDTLNKTATDHFIQLTHQRYKETCGEMFGKEILGIFTDEPYRGQTLMNFALENENAAHMTPYTEQLFAAYEKKWDQSFLAVLPELYFRKENESFSEVAYRYIDVVNDLFIDNFAKPYHSWCKDNKLIVTGHVLHEDTLGVQTAFIGSLMRYYEHMDYPGIDILCADNYCYWAVKQCVSVARQLGKEMVLSEIYGATGWHMNFQDYKRIADWQIFYGINLICPHLSWYTMKGQAKRDYPASILHQSGWYKDYSVLQDYQARLQTLLSEYKATTNVLVINPIETMFGHVHLGWLEGLGLKDKKPLELEREYEQQFYDLMQRHIDFDYGDEDIMSRHSSIMVRKGETLLRVGEIEYKEVLMLPNLHLRESTRALLKEFSEKGGKVTYNSSDLVPCDVTLPGKISLTSRKNGDELYLVMFNFDRENSVDGVKISLPQEYQQHVVQLYNLHTGNIDREMLASDIVLDFAAGQEHILKVVMKDLAPLCEEIYTELVIPESMEYTLNEPNILLLDYARYTVDGAVQNDSQLLEVLAIDRSLRAKFSLERRGGSMVQPWYSKKFNAQEETNLCDLELQFPFSVDTVPTQDVWIAIEDALVVDIFLNGNLIEKRFDGKWVDICFDKIIVSKSMLKAGENVLTIRRKFCKSSQTEAVYILGDFGVALPRTMTKLPSRLLRGDITTQGLPFYSGSITYNMGVKSGNVTIALDEVLCALIKIHGAQGNPCIAYPPYRCDCKLESELKLEYVLPRRNTFGPFHIVPYPINGFGPDAYETMGDSWTDEHTLEKYGI